MLPNKLRSKLETRPLLQVALDFIDISEAISIAEKVWKAGVDILEIGTPLIKAEGVRRAVTITRNRFPEAIILADMKTADVGALEVELAANSGADIVTVLGTADDEVIKSAINKAQELGVAIEIDMIGHRDPINRIKRIKELGADIVGLHIGIDVQRQRGFTAEAIGSLIKTAKQVFKGPIAIAGGLKPHNIPYLIELGAEIIVIGSAITKSQDPYKKAKECMDIIMEAVSKKGSSI